MSKQARSARGEVVNFDLLTIKQQLATQPVPVGVNQRRKFIDEKDGIKHRGPQQNFIVPPAQVELPSALSIAAEAVAQSAKAADTSAPKAKAKAE